MNKNLISEIVKIEWTMFDLVNKGVARASCQENPDNFNIMRSSQFQAWNENLLKSYYSDLILAQKNDRNLVELKYIYMMDLSRVQGDTELFSANKHKIIKEIMQMINECNKRLFEEIPELLNCSRPITPSGVNDDVTSIETYQIGELYTYSENTLQLFLDYLIELKENNKNYPFMIMRNTALLLQSE